MNVMIKSLICLVNLHCLINDLIQDVLVPHLSSVYASQCYLCKLLELLNVQDELYWQR